MNDIHIGVQLYTLRDQTAHDMAGVLRRLAGIGYAGVEFAGTGNLSVREARAVLDDVGLRAAACHVGAAALRADFDGAVSQVEELGAAYVVCPYIDPQLARDLPAWLAFADELEAWAQATRARGLTFAYHNHDFEFAAQHDGAYAFDLLFGRAPTVQVELDVAWAHAGGVTPREYLSKYAGRTPLVHLKDLRVEEGQFVTVELNQGEVNLAAAIAAAPTVGARWLIVEQDFCQRDPLESVTASLGWLKEHLGSQPA
ncbi:sugar phosphate isomerase/epimerase family protein [Deinococcus maricopensis]|uniref:Xylose isomerase domain-containing protein TIM barrel n=1 Tax=Deinococcus maricopensis (strain DSM 21211 / LMG 22137 / NRRL B-23946 / LB-34) TaxID=709986 RepID=E8U3G6_DEIML|nr:sugar phosphate isomerase/epimerase [Deinococcus maricopensis]ADV65837.1 Xylose isomerase domain-containing protein TIM barrel [Deinococcus maricopensis DSM 21211]